MTMPRVVAISQHAQQRAIQKVADLFTGFSLIFRRPGRWHQATAVGAKPEATISLPSFRSALIPGVLGTGDLFGSPRSRRNCKPCDLDHRQSVLGPLCRDARSPVPTVVDAFVMSIQ